MRHNRIFYITFVLAVVFLAALFIWVNTPLMDTFFNTLMAIAGSLLMALFFAYLIADGTSRH